MPMMDVPMVTGDQMMIERRVGNSGNRGLSPIYIYIYIRDWMQGYGYADAQLRNQSIRYNGTTDATLYGTSNSTEYGGNPLERRDSNPAKRSRYGQTPHASHDVGMAFDLGLREHINDANQQDGSEALNQSIASLALADASGLWSKNNATSLIDLLPDDRAPVTASNPQGKPINDQQSALKNFLALYDITQKDMGGKDSGSRDALPIKNGGNLNEQVRAALFGSGADQGLIAKVLIGGKGASQNPYLSMRAVLERLGVQSAVEDSHHNHFHIYLRPPILTPIGGAMAMPLMATDSVAVPQSELSETSAIAASVDTNLEEFVMLESLFIPYVPLHDAALATAPAMVLAQSTAAAGGSTNPISTVKPDLILQDCGDVQTPDNPSGVLGGELSPAASVRRYFNETQKRLIDVTAAKVTVIESPKQGSIVGEWQDKKFSRSFAYEPRRGFLGTDQIIFLVEVDGKRFKIVTKLYVVPVADDKGVKCFGQIKKIGSVDEIDSPQKIVMSADWLRDAGFGDVAGDFSAVGIAFDDIAGGALATATINQASTIITFDKVAAGHGWFIDSTPGQNEEFLPTSNPDEWVAKEGSAAWGKMDMLSVFLHEYGHVLGIEHSADSHDYMATTLEPGVRRVLSVDQQLQLMALTGYFPVPDSPSQPYGPHDPGSPLPFTRTSASRFGRQRPSFGQGKTEFDTVANPKLESPDFTDGPAWATQGDVAFGDGTATLKETSTTQTRLNQVFVVGEHDRFLSFSLAGLGLGDQAAGPDDAFEVALIDASTGAALLGGTGLSRSDALLNLQANGNERKASNVSRLQNADGSRTYLVDLAGIAAGTVVNLSFDLIGFGKGFEAANSQITVRDLRLGVPQTADDSASGSEDSAVAIDALANDLNALQPGFVPVVVSGPAHGSVTVEANGSFTYLPNANWSGEDEFTYRLSDGVVDSNLATVRITVAPVNDAPTVADVSLAGQEDTAVSGNVLATATDVDGDALTAALVTGPAHGTLLLAADGGFTYTPEADWHGEDSFTVRVNDGALDSAIATVRLTVAAVNDAPIVAPEQNRGLSPVLRWSEKEKTFADMASGEYAEMLCLETVNAGPADITVAPGGRHSLVASISVT